MRKRASRPHSSWGRARGGRRSAPSPCALPCPGSQLVVISPAWRHLDVLTPMHAEASRACTVMGTGVGISTLGAGVESVAVLVAGGHGRRTAPVALGRCRAPRLNLVVLSTNIVVRGRSQASSRPHSSWGRARGGRRSAPGSSSSALTCPGSQLVVLSTARRHLDVLTPMHAEASRA